MTRGKSIIGVLVLSALAVGVVGAASASASVSGMTAVACQEVAVNAGPFLTSECSTSVTGEGDFDTVAVPKDTKVVSTGENPKLEATVALAKVIVTCELATGTGKVTNTTVGEEMKGHGTEAVITYSGCHVRRVSTPGETCKISNGGTITTNKLTTTTLANHEVSVQPETGEVFAEFEILNEGTECKIPKSTVKVTGTIIGIANTEKHNHLTFEPATNGTKLKANGGTATYTGTEVGYMDEGPGEPHGAPVGLTTAAEFSPPPTGGLRSVTCQPVDGGSGTGDFATDHCETPSVEKGDFETAPLPNGANVLSTGENPRFSGTIALTKVIVECQKSNSTGSVSNVTVGEELRVHRKETELHYTGCYARRNIISPEKEKCKVEDVATASTGTILTQPLTSTSGIEHKVVVKPEAETEIAKFEVLNEAFPERECKLPKATVTITGEVTGIANTEKHAHLTFETATNGSALKMNGGAANYTATEVSYVDEEGLHGNTVGMTTVS